MRGADAEARSGRALCKASGLSGTGRAGPPLGGGEGGAEGRAGGRGRVAGSRTPGRPGAARSAQGALFSGRGEEFSFRGGAEWGFTRSGDSPSETEQVREEEGRLRGTCASELGPPGRSCVAAGLREGSAG